MTLKHATILSRCGSGRGILTCYMMYGSQAHTGSHKTRWRIQKLYVKIIHIESINHFKFRVALSRILPVSIIFVGEDSRNPNYKKYKYYWLWKKNHLKWPFKKMLVTRNIRKDANKTFERCRGTGECHVRQPWSMIIILTLNYVICLNILNKIHFVITASGWNIQI